MGVVSTDMTLMVWRHLFLQALEVASYDKPLTIDEWEWLARLLTQADVDLEIEWPITAESEPSISRLSDLGFFTTKPLGDALPANYRFSFRRHLEDIEINPNAPPA